MSIKRRKFLNVSVATVAAGLVSPLVACNSGAASGSDEELAPLENMVVGATTIAAQEREQRIKKAQQLMSQHNINALILDCGTSLRYFTGVSWWPSERTMVAIVPAQGEVKYVCPAFEKDRLNEMITDDRDVLVWEEDENPFKLIASVVSDIDDTAGKVAMEEHTRFFIYDGVRKEAPGIEFVSADLVVIPCRNIKSAAEIALMQRATDITVVAMRTGIDKLKEGMTPDDVASMIAEAHARLGAVHDFAVVSFGASSAMPHGSHLPQTLKTGDVVMLDCGCNVLGYSSDITRTVVFGARPTPRQLEIWNLEKQAQSAGLAAAKLGAACEEVDAAARKVITDAGFGPGYKLPGLPHRTGHGIGMDGHEWPYIVKGNKQLLQPGMCFSIEPTISIPGEFGVRHEDCVYMTEDGPKWFSQPSPSIDRPFV